MKNLLWWIVKESNLEPFGYEPNALTNCANDPCAVCPAANRLSDLPRRSSWLMAGTARFELANTAVKVLCLTA